jgi:Insertion element 4 transposase N-terminal
VAAVTDAGAQPSQGPPDAAVAAHGVGAKRSDGKLPAHVTAYLTVAMCLFAEHAYEEVAAKVTGSLSRFGVWDASWAVPSANGITQARKRLGARVMEEIFEGVVEPVATTSTPGAWVRGWRVLAIDGFEVDVPDSPANAERFAHSGSSAQHRAAYPKARVVALAECGTHAFLAAEVDSAAVGESTMAQRLYPRLRSNEMLTADRNLYSFTAWAAAAGTGAALLWRAPTGLALPVLQVLSDGTYISVVINRRIHSRPRRETILTAVRNGEDLGDDLVHLVRVIEYDVPDRSGNGTGEVIVLLSTITEVTDAGADELAAVYHQRWGCDLRSHEVSEYIKEARMTRM